MSLAALSRLPFNSSGSAPQLRRVAPLSSKAVRRLGYHSCVLRRLCSREALYPLPRSRRGRMQAGEARQPLSQSTQTNRADFAPLATMGTRESRRTTERGLEIGTKLNISLEPEPRTGLGFRISSPNPIRLLEAEVTTDRLEPRTDRPTPSPSVTSRLTPRCSGRHPGDLGNALASGVERLWLRSATQPGGAAELKDR